MAQEDDKVLERSSVKEPNIKLIVQEIEQAQTDFNTYVGRVADAHSWWQCEWENQFIDGKKHPTSKGGKCLPWPGASDARLRVVQGIVNEHVVLDLVAFWSAKVQCKSMRPLVQAREKNTAELMLQWRVYNHMKGELLAELRWIFEWKRALGLSFSGIEWEQERQIIDQAVTLDQIGQAGTALGMGDLTQYVLDPDKAYDKQLIEGLIALFPVMPRGDARMALESLRTTGQATVPVASLRINKPIVTALRAGVDVLFPSRTSNIQKARWVAKRELVDESTLSDRIVTDGYDPDFVDVALGKKGVFASWMPGFVSRPLETEGSERDMIELFHVLYKVVHNGVPCTYKTIFCDAATGGDANLYAVHRKFEYDHQKYPLVAHRHSYHFRPLLSSIGIAEESYSDELDLKRQQDGINDHTDIVLQPPMILPTLRAEAIAAQYGPRARMTSLRGKDDIGWVDIPPLDQTPILMMQMVQNRLDRRYPITGGAVDPEIKNLWRQQLGQETLGEMEQVLEQIHQLQQQYETDEDIQRVAGGDPWNPTPQDIQGQYEISATVDMTLIDRDIAMGKLDMLAKIMPLQQAGGIVFNAAASIAVPELADQLVQDRMSPTALEREKADEYNAISQILSGVEAVKPMQANPQMRLQWIQEITMNPPTQQKFMQDENAQKMLENRIKHFQSQIQQYQENPQIGRTLSATTFTNQAPQTSSQPVA